jgi:Tol biopolymer transport system component
VAAAALMGASPTIAAGPSNRAQSSPGASASTDLASRITVNSPIDGCMLIDVYDDGPADAPNPMSGIGMLCGNTFTTLVPMSSDLPFGAQWSPDHSQIAYARSGDGPNPGNVFTTNPDGSNEQKTAALAPNGGFTWSADGTSVIGGCTTPDGSNSGLCATVLATGDMTTLVASPTDGSFLIGPDVSPAGDQIVFYRRYPPFHAGNMDLWIANGDGSDAKLLIGSEDKQEYRAAFSPDGKSIVYDVSDIPGPGDLHLHDLAAGTDTTLMTTPEDDDSPIWSPDGQTIAFSAAHADGVGYDLSSIPASGGDPTLIASSDSLMLRASDWVSSGSSTESPSPSAGASPSAP